MRLQLTDQIQVSSDHRADHEVAATRNRIAVEHDGLGIARNLDRAVGLAGIDDVRGIGTGPEGLLSGAPWLVSMVDLAAGLPFAPQAQPRSMRW